MNDMIGVGLRDALTIIGILLNIIIGLLIYIFQQRVERTQSDLNAIKAENAKHEKSNESGFREVADELVAMREQITNLTVTLPNEYVKQTVIAALQMDIKADMRSVFTMMNELKTMLINMGAERRK